MPDGYPWVTQAVCRLRRRNTGSQLGAVLEGATGSRHSFVGPTARAWLRKPLLRPVVRGDVLMFELRCRLYCTTCLPGVRLVQTLQERCEADRGLEHGRGIVHLEGGPASVVIFDSNLMHGSHNNISPMRRCNLYAAFNAVSNVVQAPFSASTRRPEHLSTRASDAVPVVPME